MGQNHSLIHSCPNKINVSDCTIHFSPSGNVSRYGVLEPGQFQANPGVAGQGVFWAFTIPLIIVSLFGLILVLLRAYVFIRYLRLKDRNDGYGLLKQLRWIFTKWGAGASEEYAKAGKLSLVFIIAYGTAFYSIWKCQVSLYHFSVAIHMVLIGLSTSTQSYTITRKFYKAPLMLILRAVIFWIGYVGLELTTAGNPSDKNFTVTTKIPGKTQTDSVILLPAFCLLDDFFGTISNLTFEQQIYLAPKGQPEIILFQLVSQGIVSGATNVFAIGYNIFLFWRRRRYPDAEEPRTPGWAILVKIIFKLLGWIFCFFFTMWNLSSIIRLRNWINSSVWLERVDNINPERVIQSQGLGQLVPLVTLITILFGPVGAVSQRIVDIYFPISDAERKKLKALAISSTNSSNQELINQQHWRDRSGPYDGSIT